MSDLNDSCSTMELIPAQNPDTMLSKPERTGPKIVHQPNTNSADSPNGNLKLLNVRRAQSTPPEFSNDKFRHGGSTGQTRELKDRSNQKVWGTKHDLAQKKSRFFEKEFAVRGINSSAKERVLMDSIITVDIKLNCCLDEDEQYFHSDLSFTLSEIYQRPVACIMILVCTEVSILLNSTPDPAYYITVTALLPDIAATKNKRSAYLIQRFMADSLQIPASRGVVRFEAVAEENLATNGLTALQEIESLERKSTDAGIAISDHRLLPQRAKRAQTAPSDEREKATTLITNSAKPAFLRYRIGSDQENRSMAMDMEKPKVVKKRKSIMSFFGI